MFADLPPFASFTHAEARDGYEAVCFRAPDATSSSESRFLLEGGTAATEEGTPWSVQYRVAVDHDWRTTHVLATGISPAGYRELVALVRDGRWWINGIERADLDGCVDIDFETSLVTNTLAVHRLDLTATAPVEVPAAFVRFEDLRVERVEQSYLCVEHTTERTVFDYTSTTFDFGCQLVFDASGLVTDYPGIGHRNL